MDYTIVSRAIHSCIPRETGITYLLHDRRARANLGLRTASSTGHASVAVAAPEISSYRGTPHCGTESAQGMQTRPFSNPCFRFQSLWDALAAWHCGFLPSDISDCIRFTKLPINIKPKVNFASTSVGKPQSSCLLSVTGY